MTGTYVHLSSEERSQIEQEVDKHRVEAARLCRRLNSGASVMRLPDELLAEIFALCVSVWQDECETYPLGRRGFPNNSYSPYKWVRVTHVCHRWRELAVNTPRLWTNIMATNPEPVEVLAFRSRDMPVHVLLDHALMIPGDTMAFWAPILRAAARVHGLRVQLRYGVDPEFDPFLSSNDSPALSDLRILKLDYSRSSGRTRQLPPFVPQHLPFLHTLHASWLSYNAVQPLFCPSLKSLSLRALRMPDSRCWQPFLEALKAMPGLEDLKIQDCLFPLPSNYRQLPLLAGTAAKLPALRSLQASCHISGAGAALLLRNLCFPGDIPVEIGETSFDDYEAMPQDFDGHLAEDTAGCLLSALEYRLSSGHGDLGVRSPQVLTLHLHMEQDALLFFKGWSTTVPLQHSLPEIDFAAATPETPSGLCFTVNCDSSVALMAELLMEKLSLAPSLCSARTIAISMSPNDIEGTPVSPRSLLSALAHLSDAQTILASGHEVVGPLIISLRTPCGPQLQLPCPSLKTLYIYGLLFAERRYRPGPGGQLLRDETAFESIKHTITDRARQGCPIDRLVISNNHVPLAPERMQELRELVREVVWGGDE